MPLCHTKDMFHPCYPSYPPPSATIFTKITVFKMQKICLAGRHLTPRNPAPTARLKETPRTAEPT